MNSRYLISIATDTEFAWGETCGCVSHVFQPRMFVLAFNVLSLVVIAAARRVVSVISTACRIHRLVSSEIKHNEQ